MKYYFYLWVDLAAALKKQGYSDTECRIVTLLWISGTMALKLVILIGLLDLLLNVNLEVRFHEFNSYKINQFLNYAVNYLLTPLLFNYFVTVRKSRWIAINSKYSRDFMNINMSRGQFAAWYFIGTMILVFVSAILFAVIPVGT